MIYSCSISLTFHLVLNLPEVHCIAACVCRSRQQAQRRGHLTFVGAQISYSFSFFNLRSLSVYEFFATHLIIMAAILIIVYAIVVTVECIPS